MGLDLVYCGVQWWECCVLGLSEGASGGVLG
jgi:hypothetical protein